MRNQNLMFFIQPSESAFTKPEGLFRTYLNRFMIDEDDQVNDFDHSFKLGAPSKIRLIFEGNVI